MLIPVRMVVEIFQKNSEERKLKTFYKDTELSLALLYMNNNHPVRLATGDMFHDFVLHKEKPPLCVEGIARIIVYLRPICDTDGFLSKRLNEHWNLAEDISDASDFIKTPEPKKTTK